MLLELAAPAAGLLHGRPTTLDLEKADVELVLPGEHFGEMNPTVKVQVKTTIDLREVSDEDYAYDLDIPTYDVLRKTNHRIRRLLLVVHVPEHDEWLVYTEHGLLLRGDAVWGTLEGVPKSSNDKTQVVRLPKVNRVDKEGLAENVKNLRRFSLYPCPRG